MKKVLESRLNIIILLILTVFLVFTTRLIKFQVMDGEEYYLQSNASTRINQSVTAARGDITDVNGVPLAGGQTVFDVTVNKAYMPDGQLNEKLIRAVKILWRQGEELNDILPISDRSPYYFLDGKDSEISRLRDTVKVAVYASADDIMAKLVDRYSLQEVPGEYQRVLAGLRYTMEREGYSASYPFDIAKDVSVDTAIIIEENSRNLVGIEVTEDSKRYYADGTLLPHILGTVGPIYAEEYEQLKSQGYNLNDTLGKSGLEKTYESYLKGEDGIVQIEKNMYGEITDMTTIERPKPGNTVKLTIDADLQKRANEILEQQVKNLQSHSAGWGKECDGAAMVVLDVKTGGVLAISNYPNYDLNLYSSNYREYSADETTPLFNRALQGLYRPGSIFKVNMAVAGLAAGLIDENFTYTCHGVYDYYTVEQWGGALPGCASGTAHGTINVRQALQVSCNCFFYDLGRRLGIEKINESAHNMGLGVLTGMEINEAQGVLSSPEYTERMGGTWQAGNIIQASIGQLDTAFTPIQLATYVATVANRGKRYSTHIVDSIVSYDGSEVIYETPVTVLSETPGMEHVYDVVEQGMILASTEGNAAMYLNDLPFIVASKTGTAQVSGGLYNATMIAYGPVGNPELAIAIVTEKGGNGYNLAESVRDIFLYYYQLKEARASGTPVRQDSSSSQAPSRSSQDNSSSQASSRSSQSGSGSASQAVSSRGSQSSGRSSSSAG